MIALALLLSASPGLIERFECARCHEGLEASEVATDKHCTRCHQDILAGRFPAKPAVLARWQANLHSLNAAPDLEGVGARLTRRFVVEQLLAPRDVRPFLLATMPRLALRREEAEAIAATLVPEERLEPPRGDPARGQSRFEALKCATCHRFTGRYDETLDAPARTLAPDLALTARRFQPGALADFIRAPTLAMPEMILEEHDAEDLARFILDGAAEPAAPDLPPRLPILRRRVRFEEVERRVFKKVCWHCHSSPDFALGDGGPGNTGGFGFPPRGLDLSSYAAVMSGMLDASGERTSVFAEGEDGVPRLVLVLLARQLEELGRPLEGVRGMPLGLPSMAPADIQLVESWIAQGRPR